MCCSPLFVVQLFAVLPHVVRRVGQAIAVMHLTWQYILQQAGVHRDCRDAPVVISVGRGCDVSGIAASVRNCYSWKATVMFPLDAVVDPSL